MRFSSLVFTFFMLTGCSQLEQTRGLFKTPLKDQKIFTMSWAKNLDPIYNSGNLPIGTSSPLIYEDLVYMGSLDGIMHVYDLQSGRTIWEQDEKQPIGAMAKIFGENVYYGTLHGRLFVRHYLTGELRYATDLGSPIVAPPVFYQGRLFVHLRNHTISALDASTGKLLWSYRRSIPYSSTLQRVSVPVPYQNTVIVGFADGSVGALSIDEGIVKWEQQLSTSIKFLDVDIEPLVYKNTLIVGSASGPLHFMDPQTGAIKRTTAISVGHTPLVINTDRLIVGSVFGEIAILDLQGNIIVKEKVAKNTIGSIVKWKRVYVATSLEGRLLAINPKDLSVIESWNLGSKVSSVFGYLQEGQDKMAVYSSRNRLYVFR